MIGSKADPTAPPSHDRRDADPTAPPSHDRRDADPTAPPSHDRRDADPTAPPSHDRRDADPTDGPVTMWGPLVILALGAALAGYLGVGEGGGWMGRFLGGTAGFGSAGGAGFGPPDGGSGLAGAGGAAVHVSEGVLLGLSIVLPLAGILVAWYFHLRNRHAAEILAANVRPVQRFLENKWYIDELYWAVIIKPLWVIAQGLSLIDRFVVDGAVTVVGWMPQLLGYSLKPTERGLMQRYAVGMVGGVAVIVGGVLWLLR